MPEANFLAPDVLAAARFASERRAQSAARLPPTQEVQPVRPQPAAQTGLPPDLAQASLSAREAFRRPATAPQPEGPATTLPTPAPAQLAVRRKHRHEPARPAAAARTASAPHARHLTCRQKKASLLLPLVPHANQLRALKLSTAEYERVERQAPGSVAQRMLLSLSDNKGDIDAARTTLVPLIAYLKKHEVIAPSETTVPPTLEVNDFYLDGFLTEVASTKYARKRRRVALQLLRDAAGFNFTLGRQCHKLLIVPGSRPKAKALKTAADPAIIYHLELIAGDGRQRPLIRMSAGMAVAGAHICLRGIGAQRTGRLNLSGAFLRGEVGADYKKSDETIILDRPFTAPARGLTGTAAWALQLQLGLRGVEDEMFLIRESDSPDGDPRRATTFTNEMMTEQRSLNMLRSLMHVPAPYGDGYHPCPSTAVPFDKLTFKHLRRYFPSLAKAVGESKPDRNEIGAWAGSQAERIDSTTLDGAADAAGSCPDLYATDGADARAPYIMLRVANMARALQAALHDRKCTNGYADLARMHVQGRLPRPGVNPVRAQAVAAARPAAVNTPAAHGGRVAWHGPLRIAGSAGSSAGPH